MIGSNRTAFKQHAYSVFAASRRERQSGEDVPESVRRPMSPSGVQSAQPRLPSPAEATSLGLTEPKEARVAPVRAVVEALAKPEAPVAEATQATKLADPSQEEIRARAYELFLARNGQPGDPVADWLRAEAELRRERSKG